MRDFRLFWAGQTVSRLGSAITTVALPLVAVGALHASTLEVALLSAASWLPWVLIGLPVGVWVDRLPRRPLMIVCNLVALVALATAPVFLSFAHLFAVALVVGAAAVFLDTAAQVYLPSLLDASSLNAGNARLHGSEAAAQVVGPGVGGLIAQLSGAVFGLLADGFTFLLAAVGLLFVRGREPVLPVRRKVALGDGLRFLVRDRYLRTMTLFGAAANLALLGYQSILVVFLVRENGIAPGLVGVVVAAMSSGGVLGALFAARVARRFGEIRGMVLCQVVAAPFALLIPMAGAGLVMLGGFAVGAGIVAGNVIKDSFRQTYTPRHLLGRVITAMQLLNYGSIPLGALIAGLLATAIGLRPAMWVMTSALVASTLLVVPLLKDERMEELPARLARTRRFTAGAPTDFTWADGNVRFLRDGDLFEADGESGEERLLAAGVESYHGPAFVRGGELWTVNGGLRATGRVTRVRSDPAGRRFAYAVNDALRVLDHDVDPGPAGRDVDLGPAGQDFVWSLDGTRLLVTLVDDSGVPFAAAGEPLPRVTLAVVGLDGSRREFAVGGYLARAGWDRHGPYAVVLSRDQRTLRLLALDPEGVVHEQQGEPWVNVVPGLPARLDDGTVVAHQDIDDTRHLTVAGKVVTPAGLQLRAVLAVGQGVVFTASTEPDATKLWSYRGGLRCLADGPGAVQDGEFVHFGTPGHVTVIRERSVAVRSRSEIGAPRAYRIGLKRAALMLPPGHRAGVGVPVLLDPYGGPARQRVAGVPDWRDLLSEWFAEQGFAVLVADGAGTPGGGPRDERRIYGDLYTEPINDQIRSLREAADACPDLDLGRVGIRGWSFGGSLALAAVLRRPDVFHAGIAGAAVTDQRLYHAESRERYLGDPGLHPEHYDAGDLAADAPRLARPLLLMHGLADTNVRPVHTTRMVAALKAAGREHEVLYLPGIGHSAIGSPATEQILSAQLAFLRKHLL